MHSFNQVKLIVTDMDGTLLNSQKQLPPHFFDILDCLAAKGIRFGIASGRSYPSLAAQFRRAKDHMIFIAENGACIMDSDKLIYAAPLSAGQVSEIAKTCYTIERIYPLYSCQEHVYVPDTTPEDICAIVRTYYDPESIVYIHSLDEIAEQVYKVTICDPEGAETHSWPILRHLDSPYRVNIGGFIWIDVFLDCVNKGTGVHAIREKYNISYDETMLFGDYLNDCSMMPEGHFSYAMANAHPDLKALCNFTTLSNDEDGVMHIVKKCLCE